MLNIVSVLIQSNLDISNVHAIHIRAGLKCKRRPFWAVSPGRQWYFEKKQHFLAFKLHKKMCTCTFFCAIF